MINIKMKKEVRRTDAEMILSAVTKGEEEVIKVGFLMAL